jgi:hypothetical protein
MRRDLNPQPFNHESSLLSTRPGFRLSTFLLLIHPIVKLYNEYEISIVFIYLILYFNIWRHTYKYSTAQKCVVAHWLRDTDVMTCHLGPKVKQYFGCLKM